MICCWNAPKKPAKTEPQLSSKELQVFTRVCKNKKLPALPILADSQRRKPTTHNKTSWRYNYYGTFQRKNQQLSQSGESCLNTATSAKAACSERQTRQSKRAAPDSGTICERIVCSLTGILSEFARKSPDRWDIPYYNRATIKGKELNKRTMQEASRIILGLRAAGWDEKSINDFILWIETGNNEYKPKKDLPA